MPSRNPKAAVDQTVERLRLVASCVTDRPVLASGYRRVAHPYRFFFASPQQPVHLRTRAGGRLLSLAMEHDYIVTSPAGAPNAYEVRTTGYRYYLLDSLGREILAYHWHPEGVSPITQPHLHLSGRLPPLDLGPGVTPAALGEMHLPTGPISLVDIVQLLITEFGIAPRRADWEAILEAERAQNSPDG